MTRFFLTGALAAAGAGFGVSAAAEEDDARTNVHVSTKRASIGSRSLPHLAELTEANSPTIRRAKELLEGKRLEETNARVTFWPSLDAEGTHGLRDTFPTTQKTAAASYMNLKLSENIYDNGVNLNRLAKAGLELRKARLEFEYIRDEQLQQMANAYLDWSASAQMREIDENKRDLLRRQFAELEAQYKQGLKTKRDVLRIETEMRRLEMAILERDNEVDLNFQKLSTWVGLSHDELGNHDLEGEEPRPYTGGIPNASEIKAATHRRARILELAVESLDVESRIAQRNLWPQVFVSAQAGYTNQNYLDTATRFDDTRVWDWSALVTLRYNIWDFGTRRRQVEIAKVAARVVANENAAALNSLSNDLRDVWNKLRQFREQVKMSRELLSLEQQSYSILEAEYRNGRASYLDLITNLNSLIDARAKFITAYFGLRKQQNNYAFHKGDLYEQLK